MQSNKLKFWRVERKLSQLELSAASGVPRHLIQLCEQGIRTPVPVHQIALANVLGVDNEQVFPAIKIPIEKNKTTKI